MSINGLNSAKPMYGHDRGSRGGVRARDVSRCVSYVYFWSIFFFSYCIFFLIANIFINIFSCDDYNNSNCIHHSLPLSLYHLAGNRWDKRVGVTGFRDGKWQRDGAQTTTDVVQAIVKFFSS